MALIEMQDVVKAFRIKQRQSGPLRGLREFFRPLYRTKRAVDGISLAVERGELVGYIGPNGAGKSTTLKMLTGILVPTEGQVTVDGRNPHRNRKANALHMGAVFGQRSQLLWDLPVNDTLELYQRMYRIEPERYRRNRERFTELLDMGDFLDQPARQLSLGQKMRANLALALLHDPEIVYLDEPTIGLDVLAKDRIRGFIRQINRERSTTVMLTTHDMTDIESLCDRLVLIDGGKKLYDGPLERFRQQNAATFVLQADFVQADARMNDVRFVEQSREDARVEYVIRCDALTPGEALTLLAREHALKDVRIRETTVEEVVRELYKSRKTPSN